MGLGASSAGAGSSGLLEGGGGSNVGGRRVPPPPPPRVLVPQQQQGDEEGQGQPPHPVQGAPEGGLPPPAPVAAPVDRAVLSPPAPAPLVAKCAPGSPFRFRFAPAPASAQPRGALPAHAATLLLEAVDVGFALLPKWGAAAPLPPHLYRQLASTAGGARLLARSGHLGCLLEAAFGCPLHDAAAVPPEDGSATQPLPRAAPAGDATLPARGVGERHSRSASAFSFDDTAPPAPSHVGPATDPLQRRAALWALGHVASSPHGYAVLAALAPDFILRVDAAARGLRLRLGVGAASGPATGVAASAARVACGCGGSVPALYMPPIPAAGGGISGGATPEVTFSAAHDAADDVGVRAAAAQVLALIACHPVGYAAAVTLGWCPAAPTPGAMLRAAAVSPLMAAGALPSAGGASGLVTSHLLQSIWGSGGGGGAGGGGGGGEAGRPAPLTVATTTERGSLILLPQVPRTAFTLALGEPSSGAAAAGAAAAMPVDDTSDPEAFLFQARLPPLQAAWAPVLARVGELAARITQRDARNALLRLRAESPDLFGSPGLYAHVHALLSRYALTLPARRFVHALFERVSFSDRAWDFNGAVAGAPVPVG